MKLDGEILRTADLSKADLSGVDLREADLSGVNLRAVFDASMISPERRAF